VGKGEQDVEGGKRRMGVAREKKGVGVEGGESRTGVDLRELEGGAQGCEAYEVKQRVALVRMPFYFINLLPTSLLYMSILLTEESCASPAGTGSTSTYIQTPNAAK